MRYVRMYYMHTPILTLDARYVTDLIIRINNDEYNVIQL
jgi:hypothetical protein